MNPSRIREVLATLETKRHAHSRMNRRNRRPSSMTTVQWLILISCVAVFVGGIFILTIYYSTGK